RKIAIPIAGNGLRAGGTSPGLLEVMENGQFCRLLSSRRSWPWCVPLRLRGGSLPPPRVVSCRPPSRLGSVDRFLQIGKRLQISFTNKKPQHFPTFPPRAQDYRPGPARGPRPRPEPPPGDRGGAAGGQTMRLRIDSPRHPRQPAPTVEARLHQAPP